MKLRNLALLATASAATLAFVAPAAASVDVAVPTNAYIVFGGLDWAWISPCAPNAPSCGDTDLFEFQGGLGWRLPTAAEFAARPQASDFLFRGANVPQGGVDPISLSRFGAGGDAPVDVGSDGACAAGYFGDVHRHCDFSDGAAGLIWGPAGPNQSFFETWAVRGGAIPEPATWALMVGGFGVAGGAMRYRRRRTTVTFA